MSAVLPSTKDAWLSDMAKMDVELRRLGAIKTTADGFQYVDESVCPKNRAGSSAATVYQGLVQFGYANGYFSSAVAS